MVSPSTKAPSVLGPVAPTGDKASRSAVTSRAVNRDLTCDQYGICPLPSEALTWRSARKFQQSRGRRLESGKDILVVGAIIPLSSHSLKEIVEGIGIGANLGATR